MQEFALVCSARINLIYAAAWNGREIEEILCTKLLPLYNCVFYKLFSNPKLFTSADFSDPMLLNCCSTLTLTHTHTDTPEFSIITNLYFSPAHSITNGSAMQTFHVFFSFPLSLACIRSTANYRYIYIYFGNLIEAFGVTHSYSYFIFSYYFVFFSFVALLRFRCL